MNDLKQKIAELEAAYNELDRATTKFGLNNFGSLVHNSMLQTLQVMREEFHKLKEKTKEVRV